MSRSLSGRAARGREAHGEATAPVLAFVRKEQGEGTE